MTFVLLFIIAVCFLGLFLLYRMPKKDKPITATPLLNIPSFTKNSAAKQPAEPAEQDEQPSADDFSQFSDEFLVNRFRQLEYLRKDLMKIQMDAARSGSFGLANLGITNQISDIIDKQTKLRTELNARGVSVSCE